MRSRIISPVIAPVVATKPMASRSWQSSEKATCTRSPFQQRISKPSLHQRRFDLRVMMVPSWTRFGLPV
jgi:hypothetical protein